LIITNANHAVTLATGQTLDLGSYSIGHFEEEATTEIVLDTFYNDIDGDTLRQRCA